MHTIAILIGNSANTFGGCGGGAFGFISFFAFNEKIQSLWVWTIQVEGVGTEGGEGELCFLDQ